MGLFSFGNKDAAPARRSRTSAGAERQGGARASRSSGGEPRTGQASLLDPTLPEKQRARRRLIGAIALVLAAVVVLPMVLDSHPKPASDDIAVNIPRVVKAPAAAPLHSNNPPAPDVSNADVSPSDNPSPAMTGNLLAASQPNQAPAPASASLLKSGSAKPLPASQAVEHGAKAPLHSASAAATASVSPPANTASAIPHPPGSTAPSTSRFVVLVGSFASDLSAHAWLAKLKAVGVPAYLESKRLADGTQHILLRAGPFGDRASAEAAVKKVRDAGLSAQSSAQASVASGTAQ